MQVFSYLPKTTPGPNGSTTRYTDTDPGTLTEIGTYNNRAIVISPDGTTPPGQPPEIDWQPETASPILATWISQTRYGQLLEAARARKHDARRAARLAAETAGFTFSHASSEHPIDSDRDSVLRITSAAAVAQAALAASAPFSIDWLCADDTNITLDAAGILALQGDLVAHGQACHDASQLVKAQIDAAETLAELSAIDLTAAFQV